MLPSMSDGYEPIRRALAFVEQRLTVPVTLAEIAREACLSPWHFHRVFTGVVGETPIGYLRRRRLSEAARALRGSTRSVLEIALEYGFESQAAFTRAFRNQYGLPPHRFRREVVLAPNLLYEPLRPEGLAGKGNAMEPKMIERPAFTVVGLSRMFTPETTRQIPQMWGEFVPRMGEIAATNPRECYGLCVPLEKTAEDQPCFIYACALETAPEAPVPAEFARFEVPAARYAVFTFEDHISRIGAFLDKVFGEWFPATGLPRVSAPEFEFYDERFDGGTGHGQVDYYIPVALL